MSDFWKSSLGEVTGKPEDAFAKTFTIIPDGTMALAKIASFEHAEYQGSRYLSVDWMVIDGAFKGSKVNQKLRVFDDNEKVRHRALNMLKLLYQQFNLKPLHADEPNNDELSVFIDKIAGLKINETDPNIEGKSYNWVAEVHKAAGFKCETGVPKAISAPKQSSLFDSALSTHGRAAKDSAALVDDIPFN